MALPVYVDGQVLDATDCNNYFLPQPAIKPSDQNITSSTTLTNDTALLVALQANASYSFQCTLYYKGGTNAASDFKWTFTAPSGAVLRYAVCYNAVSLTGQVSINHVGTDVVSAGTNGTGNVLAIMMQGSLTTSSTTGNLQLQWAQNTSNATATTVGTASIITLLRVA